MSNENESNPLGGEHTSIIMLRPTDNKVDGKPFVAVHERADGKVMVYRVTKLKNTKATYDYYFLFMAEDPDDSLKKLVSAVKGEEVKNAVERFSESASA